MSDLEALLTWLSIVPLSMGLIVGLIGTPMAVAHGDWIAALICLLIGVGSGFGIYLAPEQLRRTQR